MINEIEYYQAPPSNYRRTYKVGQIFLVPVPFRYGSRIPYLRLDYPDPHEVSESTYKLDSANISSFDPKTLKPLSHLKLSSDSFLMALVHKFRPVIILSEVLIDWKDYKNQRDKGYLVVPLYSVKDAANHYKYSEDFLLRVQAYVYPELFYLPESEEFGIKESLVRFDKIFCVSEQTLQHQPKMLSEDAILCLKLWLEYFVVREELDEMLQQYREAAMENLA